MSTIEKMNAYIQRTNIKNTEYYEMALPELQALYETLKIDIYEALTLAFHYGMSKGYRIAKRKAK